MLLLKMHYTQKAARAYIAKTGEAVGNPDYEPVPLKDMSERERARLLECLDIGVAKSATWRTFLRITRSYGIEEAQFRCPLVPETVADWMTLCGAFEEFADALTKVQDAPELGATRP